MKEFERWWKGFCEQRNDAPPNEVKVLMWTAWKIGREKIYEEMIHTQLQRAA